jgi:hypothetical protein
VFNALEHRYHYSWDASDENQKQGTKALIVWCKGGYLSLISSGFEPLHPQVSLFLHRNAYSTFHSTFFHSTQRHIHQQKKTIKR